MKKPAGYLHVLCQYGITELSVIHETMAGNHGKGVAYAAEQVGMPLWSEKAPEPSKEVLFARKVAPGIASMAARGVPDYRSITRIARHYQRQFLVGDGRWAESTELTRLHARLDDLLHETIVAAQARRNPGLFRLCK